jgi:hypothetical protein
VFFKKHVQSFDAFIIVYISPSGWLTLSFTGSNKRIEMNPKSCLKPIVTLLLIMLGGLSIYVFIGSEMGSRQCISNCANSNDTSLSRVYFSYEPINFSYPLDQNNFRETIHQYRYSLHQTITSYEIYIYNYLMDELI